MGLTLVPMTEADYDAWFDGQLESYAQSRARAGAEPLADARVVAAQQFAELLPDGLATADHELFTLHDGDEQVGTIWLAIKQALHKRGCSGLGRVAGGLGVEVLRGWEF